MRVFINGCFDILTVGHFNLLTFARKIADNPIGELIVALDENEKIMASKGLKRPIFDVTERAKAILDIKIGDKQLVDNVLFFHTDYELEMVIKRIRPDYIVKGGDWRGKHVVGSEVAKVVMFDRMQDYSTTEIIRRVMEKHAH